MNSPINRDIQSSGIKYHYKSFKGLTQVKTSTKKKNKTFCLIVTPLSTWIQLLNLQNG